MVQMFMRDLKKVSTLERFCYKGFLRNSSGTKFFVRFREVSALEDVRLGRFHCTSILKSKYDDIILRYCPPQLSKEKMYKQHFLFNHAGTLVLTLFLKTYN